MDGESSNPVAMALNERAIAEGWGTRCDPSLVFANPSLTALYEVWHDKARTAGIPSRDDFDARTLKPFLRNLAIAERARYGAGWSYRFRYYGSGLVQYFGEQTGRFVEEFVVPEGLARWVAGYDAVLAGRAPLRFTSRFQLTTRLNYLDVESFCAPLANGTAEPNMLLSAIYFTPKPNLQAKIG